MKIVEEVKINIAKNLDTEENLDTAESLEIEDDISFAVSSIEYDGLAALGVVTDEMNQL